MPPRKAPAVRRTPAARPNRRGRAPNSEEAQDAPVLMNPSQLQTIVAQTVAAALAAYETARNESSGHSGNPGENLGGNPGGIQGGTPAGNHGSGPSNPRFGTLKEFLACKPKNFRGTEGVVGMTRWIEKMENVFHLSSCSSDCRVKFATSTLLDAALSWWNDQAKSMGLEVAYALDWATFKGMLVEEYCPRQEIQKLEQELWTLTMHGSEVAAYTSRFNDLASLCPGMVNPEHKKIERYIWGLASSVQGHVTASRPTTFDSAKRLAYQITEQCIRQGTMAPQTGKNPKGSTKRESHSKSEGDSKRYKPEPEPLAICAAITNTPTPSKTYCGNLPHCAKCRRHHYGDCLVCSNCKLKGHTLEFCRKAPTTAPTNPST